MVVDRWPQQLQYNDTVADGPRGLRWEGRDAKYLFNVAAGRFNKGGGTSENHYLKHLPTLLKRGWLWQAARDEEEAWDNLGGDRQTG